MPNIPELPKEGVKNHFFGLSLFALAVIIVSLIYRPSFLAPAFVLLVTFLSMFVINIFFVKAIHNSKVRDANRKLEFVLIAVAATVGLFLTGFLGWEIQRETMALL